MSLKEKTKNKKIKTKKDKDINWTEEEIENLAKEIWNYEDKVKKRSKSIK